MNSPRDPATDARPACGARESLQQDAPWLGNAMLYDDGEVNTEKLLLFLSEQTFKLFRHYVHACSAGDAHFTCARNKLNQVAELLSIWNYLEWRRVR